MLTIVAALAGVDPKDIAIEITSQDVGQVHQSGFVSGQFFRSMHFPKPIETAKARAEYKNGLLTVTAPVATEAQAMRLDIVEEFPFGRGTVPSIRHSVRHSGRFVPRFSGEGEGPHDVSVARVLLA